MEPIRDCGCPHSANCNRAAEFEAAAQKSKPKFFRKIAEKLKAGWYSLSDDESWSRPGVNDPALVCGLLAAWLLILGLWVVLFYYIVLCALKGPTWLALVLSLLGLPHAWCLQKSCYRKTVDVAAQFQIQAEEKKKRTALKTFFRAFGSAFIATDQWIQIWCDLDAQETVGILLALYVLICSFALVFFCFYGLIYICLFDGPFLLALCAIVCLWGMKFVLEPVPEEVPKFFAELKKKHPVKFGRALLNPPK